MRIWSIHPQYLDSKGLVALWRETLLARNVLAGNTKGYKNHPQLNRFKKSDNPLRTIDCYLEVVFEEAQNRGYKFDRSKFVKRKHVAALVVNSGQVEYEFSHLQKKLKKRDPEKFKDNIKHRLPAVHPLFTMVDGDIEDWEVT